MKVRVYPEGTIKIKEVIVTHYRGIIQINIQADRKYLRSEHHSTLGPGSYRSETVSLRPERGRYSPTHVELIAEGKHEHHLMNHGWFQKVYWFYGAIYLLVPRPNMTEQKRELVYK